MEIIFAYGSGDFFVCGGLWFLLGVLGILYCRCGFFVDKMWWIVWLGWFVDGRFLGAVDFWIYFAGVFALLRLRMTRLG
jgi:hypothetical protein